VVVGVRCDQVGEKLRELYEPFLRTEKPFLIMSPESAELTKYVANAMLATKISFINTMANLTQKMGGDINDVRRGIGHDSRIGFSFLFPGVGYGGSCFPKDVRALERMFEQAGIDPTLLKAVDQINELQKHELLVKIENHMGKDLTGKTIAIWGLAFKPRTDDIREAPALVMMEKLLAAGATLKVHDPEAMNNVAAEKMAIDNSDKIEYCEFPMDALEGADALAINTEWSEFRNPDFSKIKQLMNSPVIFDGRNLYKRSTMQELGFTYYSIGRQPVPEN
ncbi:MAG: UDP-glucose 6-dehydrogenase, partial [Blastopirellula sp.]